MLLKLREELHHERERDVVVERRADDESARGEQHEWDRHPFFFEYRPGAMNFHTWLVQETPMTI